MGTMSQNAFIPARVAGWRGVKRPRLLSRFCPLQPPSSDLVTVLRKLGFDLSHGIRRYAFDRPSTTIAPHRPRAPTCHTSTNPL